MIFCSAEGVVWKLPFVVPQKATEMGESDLLALRAVYGSTYEPVSTMDKETECSPQWVH